jgi:glycosyltransferase involved in cell wall biosynthesis
MKVCFLAGTLGRGGAERQLIFMLNALRQEGVEVRLLCLTKGEAYEREIRDLGIEPEWVGSTHNRLLRLRKVIGSIRNRPTDIVQSSHFYTNIYAAAACKFTGAASIGAIRSDLESEMAADRIFGRWQVELPDHLVANSELSVRRAVAFGIARQKIDCVRNVVSVGPLNGCAESRSGDRSVNLLFVGRLTEEKRPEWFIDLATHMQARSASIKAHFRIAGDGPLRPELERMVRDRQLTEVVHFLGEQQDMAETYANADLLVLTSRYEGTPNVLLEAMAYGVPVVATRVGGVSEIVNDNCGIVVDPLSFPCLAEAVMGLAAEPFMRKEMGNAGRAYVERNHSTNSLGRHLIGIYQKLVYAKGT